MRLTPPHRTRREPDPAAAPATARRTAGRRALRRRAVVLTMSLALVIVTGDAAFAAPPHEVLALAPDVGTVLNNIRNWIMGILAGLGTVFLTVGGVRYLMSAGDPGEVGKAKDAFKNAGWGYGLAALAPVAVEILKGITGA